MKFRLLLLCAGLILAPLTTSASQRLDPPNLPETWQDLFINLRGRPPLRANFSEERILPFRRDPIVLNGILRLDTNRGLSLHYPEAKGSPTTVIDSMGMATRSNETDWQVLPDRRSIRPAHAAIAALLSLDFERLSEDFELIGEMDQAVWSVQLSPKPGADTGRLTALSISGTPVGVTELRIGLGGNRGIFIKLFSEESVPAFGPEEYARFFR